MTIQTQIETERAAVTAQLDCLRRSMADVADPLHSVNQRSHAAIECCTASAQLAQHLAKLAVLERLAADYP